MQSSNLQSNASVIPSHPIPSHPIPSILNYPAFFPSLPFPLLHPSRPSSAEQPIGARAICKRTSVRVRACEHSTAGSPFVTMPRLPLPRHYSPAAFTKACLGFGNKKKQAFSGPPQLAVQNVPRGGRFCTTLHARSQLLKTSHSPRALSSSFLISSSSSTASSPTPTTTGSSVPARRPHSTIPSVPQRRSDKAWPYLYKDFDEMAHLDPYFKQVDGLAEGFIERLRQAVAIPSISSEDARRPDVVKASIPPTAHPRAYSTVLS